MAGTGAVRVCRYFFFISSGQNWDGILKYGAGTLGPFNLFRILGLTTVQLSFSAEEEGGSSSEVPLLLLLLETSSRVAQSVTVASGDFGTGGTSVPWTGVGWWALVGVFATRGGL